MTTNWIPLKEAATMRGVSEQTMRRYCKQGKVIACTDLYRKWHVSRTQLEIQTQEEWTRLIARLSRGYRLISINGYKDMDKEVYEKHQCAIGIRYRNRLFLMVKPSE